MVRYSWNILSFDNDGRLIIDAGSGGLSGSGTIAVGRLDVTQDGDSTYGGVIDASSNNSPNAVYTVVFN